MRPKKKIKLNRDCPSQDPYGQDPYGKENLRDKNVRLKIRMEQDPYGKEGLSLVRRIRMERKKSLSIS